MRILCMLPAAKGVYPTDAEDRRLALKHVVRVRKVGKGTTYESVLLRQS